MKLRHYTWKKSAVALSIAILSICAVGYGIKKASYPISLFRDVAKFKLYEGKKFDIVNLGSRASMYAFDRDACGVNGDNFAGAPQCGTYDFALLRHYGNLLASNAVVLICICPFSSILPVDYAVRQRESDIRYYAILDRSEIFAFSWLKATRVWITLNILNQGWECLLFNDALLESEHVADDDALFSHAELMIGGWKCEFGISDLSGPIQARNAAEFDRNVARYSSMVAWCRSRGYRPVLIDLPRHVALNEALGDDFCKTYIEDFAARIDCAFLNHACVPLYDGGHTTIH